MKATNVFLGADMRMMHFGLTELAKTKGVRLDRLDSGEMVCFVNAARNRLKVYTYNGVVGYIKFTGDSRRTIDLEAIDEMAKAFRTDGSVNYARGLRTALEKRLKIRGRVRELEVL